MLIQKNSLRSKTHRDKSYIIKDLISALVKSGEINQTLLATFCGINITKHRKILVDLETNELISKHEEKIGKQTRIIYKATQKGYEFCNSVLIPFEQAFPRDLQH
jgi:predicted transcriptional regulator